MHNNLNFANIFKVCLSGGELLHCNLNSTEVRWPKGTNNNLPALVQKWLGIELVYGPMMIHFRIYASVGPG